MRGAARRRRSPSGIFVAIDGPDAVGKTTLAKSLVQFLRRSLSQRVRYTHEPTNSQSGRLGRALFTSGTADVNDVAEAFIADRVAHLGRVILPALSQGETVIADRYKYSTVVYQSLAGVSASRLVNKNRFRKPDLTLILLCDAELLRERLLERDGPRASLPSRRALREVIAAYRDVPSWFRTERFLLVDASRSKREVARRARVAVLDLIENRSGDDLMKSGPKASTPTGHV
jgi:dTMP kinase